MGRISPTDGTTKGSNANWLAHRGPSQNDALPFPIISVISYTQKRDMQSKPHVPYFYFILYNSSFIDLNNEYIIITMTNENGKAAMIIVFCKARSPPAESKINAIVETITPQITFTEFGGVNEPYVDCIPNT